MVKVVFLIMSGDQKMDLALRMAAASVANRRFEDLKIIFFGPSQERLLNLEGQAKEDFDYLLKNGAVDSACINYAKGRGIDSSLLKIKIDLKPAGERVSYYMNNGYQVLTF